ncbi:hypothetical protein TrST_g13363 [Triparma strigata]|uniref:AP2/ERF domain-containing protein n=1 Tax=Triparma strigata TaxID=1606541 RepID=A0A9W7F1Q4_9STRA|nr:hypothetical protein TrST_g13363 [Triparma strigata]
MSGDYIPHFTFQSPSASPPSSRVPSSPIYKTKEVEQRRKRLQVDTQLPSILALNSPGFFKGVGTNGMGGYKREDDVYGSRPLIASPPTSLHGSYSWLSSPLGTFSPDTTSSNLNVHPFSSPPAPSPSPNSSASLARSLSPPLPSSSPSISSSSQHTLTGSLTSPPSNHFIEPVIHPQSFNSTDHAINEYLNSINKLRNVKTSASLSSPSHHVSTQTSIRNFQNGRFSIRGGTGEGNCTAVKDLNDVLKGTVVVEEIKGGDGEGTKGGRGEKKKRVKQKMTKAKPAKATKKKPKSVIAAAKSKPKLKPKPKLPQPQKPKSIVNAATAAIDAAISTVLSVPPPTQITVPLPPPPTSTSPLPLPPSRLRPLPPPTQTYRGVTQRPSGKWQSQLYHGGKSRYIGVFDNCVEASKGE